MALEIKSVDSLVGTPISYAYAVKAGPWVFLTEHEAFDWRTGTIDASVSGPAGFPAYGTRHPSRREADLVPRRMTDVLREYGTDLSHAVRLDQYYPNPRAVAAYPIPIYAGRAIFALLLMSNTAALAHPMHVLASTPAAEAIMHGRNAQYDVRYDGPVDHEQSRLEILRDGHVVQHLTPLLDSATDVLFASAPAPEPATICFIGS